MSPSTTTPISKYISHAANCASIVDQSSVIGSTPSIKVTELSSRKRSIRQPEQSSNDDFQKKVSLTNDEAAKDISVIENIGVRKSDCKTGSAGDNSIEAKSVFDPTTDTKDNENSNQIKSTEWNRMNTLVQKLFRNKSNKSEPLSSSELRLKNKILIKMSTNPYGIRSKPVMCRKIRQSVSERKFEKFINECRTILINLGRADTETQANFSELRKKFQTDIKQLNCRRSTTKVASNMNNIDDSKHLNLNHRSKRRRVDDDNMHSAVSSKKFIVGINDKDITIAASHMLDTGNNTAARGNMKSVVVSNIGKNISSEYLTNYLVDEIKVDRNDVWMSLLLPAGRSEQDVSSLQYKLTIPEAHYSVVMKPETWPKDVRVRDFCPKTPVRLPKRFCLPFDRFIDVPFVVRLHDKSDKMSEEYANDVTRVLLQLSNTSKNDPKPKIRDIKFQDDTLLIVCINAMTFEWLKKTISSRLDVTVRSVKNVITRNELKTICLKFEIPQYLHFNYMMEQLKAENPRLHTQRWELRSQQHKNFVDSTKDVYVGVDIESLIILEDMNRVGTLRGSSVTFEISYGDSEGNFEKTNIVKKKNQPKYKADN